MADTMFPGFRKNLFPHRLNVPDDECCNIFRKGVNSGKSDFYRWKKREFRRETSGKM